MNALIALATRHALAVLCLLGLLTAGFATQLPRLELHASFDKMMLEGDATRAAFDRFQEVFGARETILLFLHDDALFEQDNLGTIEATIDAIAEREFVTDVSSLFSLKDTRFSDNGEMVSEPYLDATRPFQDRDALRAWIRHALANPIIADQFLSADGKGLALIINLAEGEAGAQRDALIVTELERLITPLRERLDTVVQVGSPLLRQAVNAKMVHDQRWLLPASLGLLLAMLAIIVRRLNGALIPLLTGSMSVVWALGAMALLGVEINVMTSIVPMLLIIIGSTEDIHLLSEYYAARGEGLDRRQAIARMSDRVGMAVLLTFITTALGFLSIATNPIPMLREFGLMAGFGLAANFLITTLLVPAWLGLFGGKAAARTTTGGGDNWIQAAAVRLMAWVLRRRRTLMVGSAVFLVICLIGASQIRVDNDPSSYFEAHDAVSLDRQTLEDRLTGSHTFSIVFDARVEDTFLKVRYLRALVRTQKHLEQTGLFRKTFSFADIMQRINVVMEEDDSGRLYLPEDDAIAREYALFLDPDDVAPYVSKDYSQARIQVRHTIAGSHELSGVMDDIQAFLDENLPRGVDYHITGDEVMTKHAADYMALGQVISLSLVFLVIGVLTATLFVNAQAGLIAVIPNLFPVALLFGVMGWFGLPLDTSTAMVAAIALGICVDDTMHFMVRFHRANRGREHALDALKETVRHEAMPIFSTSIALTAGFALLGLSGFPPVAHFGLLSAMMMLGALASTFLITPLLLSSVRLVSLWDMLDLHLQRRVQENCALFRDMKPWQIKKLILLSEVRRFEPAEPLFHQGEVGDVLYVVLVGNVEIWRSDKGDLRPLLQLGEGQMFGEMALIRRQPRSASVVALGQTRVLLLRWSDVERIRRIHPRIAARLFLNLASILGDRLDKAMGDLSEMGGAKHQAR
ncbi:MAG: MMPL family transporter [Gammaproteobacteria bacterium]